MRQSETLAPGFVTRAISVPTTANDLPFPCSTSMVRLKNTWGVPPIETEASGQ
jgi:hypothetical protein